MTSTEVCEKPRLSCKSKGPGPSYKLPSLIGYEKHDPSRYRSPAFTFKSRHKDQNYTGGPGPEYNVYQLTRKGVEKQSGFTLAGRWKFMAIGSGPGPGAYQPEKCPPMNHSSRSPAFSLLSRRNEKYSTDDGPGPNAYVVPSCLGPSIPHKKTVGAFSIAGRSWEKKHYDDGPGPGDYGNPDYDVIKKRYPSFSLKSRPSKLFDAPSGPGPAYNPTYNTGKSQPRFSFGVRYSDCVATAFTKPDDE